MKAELIDHMGSDLTVVNAARVSFDKQSDWEDCLEYMGHARLKAPDERLIKYLADHNHWTPFSHAVITLRETVPIFVARQRFKHMVGFTYNEVSRRYVDDEPEFYSPEVWRKRAENKKQGSSEETFPVKTSRGESIPAKISRISTELSLGAYEELISRGVAPEQARMVLPQSMYTSYYVTGSLAAWARAYKLRSKPDAQMEIQELAKQWDQLIKPLFPVSWKGLAYVN